MNNFQKNIIFHNGRKKILLVEPSYKNKYPPLGLMKIATFHVLNGDDVFYYKGNSAKIRDQGWDVIYISTLFTFQWKGTIETIKFYSKNNSNIIVGGILASLMPDDIKKETGIKPHVGPYNGDISKILNLIKDNSELKNLYTEVSKYGLDVLPPNYGIFLNESSSYKDFLNDYYFFRTSRGCTRGCKFCAISKIEPNFVERIQLSPIIKYISKNWGEKKNLLLLDDNLLLSEKFNHIIDEIKDLGFSRDSKLNGKKRRVDFNQGFDIRLLEKRHLKKLAEIEIKPLRLACDDISLLKTYEKKIQWALDEGFSEIISYLLYNYNDTPTDLYKRVELACNLNAKYGSRIASFPMKYIPCNKKHRKFVSTSWTRRQIRGIQCITNVKRLGMAFPNQNLFYVAFGKNINKFLDIIRMPENYIIKRSIYNHNGQIKKWKSCFESMSENERSIAENLISQGKGYVPFYHKNRKIMKFLSHYKDEQSL